MFARHLCCPTPWLGRLRQRSGRVDLPYELHQRTDCRRLGPGRLEADRHGGRRDGPRAAWSSPAASSRSVWPRSACGWQATYTDNVCAVIAFPHGNTLPEAKYCRGAWRQWTAGRRNWTWWSTTASFSTAASADACLRKLTLIVKSAQPQRRARQGDPGNLLLHAGPDSPSVPAVRRKRRGLREDIHRLRTRRGHARGRQDHGGSRRRQGPGEGQRRHQDLRRRRLLPRTWAAPASARPPTGSCCHEKPR